MHGQQNTDEAITEGTDAPGGNQDRRVRTGLIRKEMEPTMNSRHRRGITCHLKGLAWLDVSLTLRESP